ncbi:unnamed protein product, partial [marine sediment metagenome]
EQWEGMFIEECEKGLKHRLRGLSDWEFKVEIVIFSSFRNAGAPNPIPTTSSFVNPLLAIKETIFSPTYSVAD